MGQKRFADKTQGLKDYKNQGAYLAIPVSDYIKGLMILKNVLLCFKPSFKPSLCPNKLSVFIKFRPTCPRA